MRLYTIGFAGKSAERFFGLLAEHGVTRIIDVRLRPTGQLAGFAKKGDLPYLLSRLVGPGCDYVHVPELTPTAEILNQYRKDKDAGEYGRRFDALMDERDIPASLPDGLLRDGACLLCSEASADQCHRRLVAERLARSRPGLHVTHLR